MYARYIWRAAVSLAFNILTYILSPVLGLIAAAFRLETLPWPLVWFQTHDDTVYGGNWRVAHGLSFFPETFKERWKAAIFWLCRNPGYHFDAYILGYPIGDPLVWPHPDKLRAGVFIKYRAEDGTELFSYRHDYPLWGNRYIKIWFGWKQNGNRNTLALNFNPFHSF